MPKTTLIERMEKKSAPKSWIREVQTKDNHIERLFELLEEYLNVIDMLAREKEQLEADNERLHRFLTTREYEDRVELEAENEALCELLSPLVDVELERDKLLAENEALREGLQERLNGSP